MFSDVLENPNKSLNFSVNLATSDPSGLVNLPTFNNDIEENFQPIYKNDGVYYHLTSTPAIINRLELAILESRDNELIKYPKFSMVVLSQDFSREQDSIDCLEHPHRIFDGSWNLTEKDGKKWREVYGDALMRLDLKSIQTVSRTIFSISPSSLLFGSFGTHCKSSDRQKSTAPLKFTSLVEGTLLAKGPSYIEETVSKKHSTTKHVPYGVTKRIGSGSFLPKLPLSGDDAEPENGLSNVPFSIKDFKTKKPIVSSLGAICVENPFLFTSLHFERLLRVKIGTTEENHLAQEYLLNLFIYAAYYWDKYIGYDLRKGCVLKNNGKPTFALGGDAIDVSYNQALSNYCQSFENCKKAGLFAPSVLSPEGEKWVANKTHTRAIYNSLRKDDATITEEFIVSFLSEEKCKQAFDAIAKKDKALFTKWIMANLKDSQAQLEKFDLTFKQAEKTVREAAGKLFDKMA